MKDMPIGLYAASFEASIPANGALKITLEWQDANNANIGTADNQTINVTAIKNTVNFSLNKPSANHVSLFMAITH